MGAPTHCADVAATPASFANVPGYLTLLQCQEKCTEIFCMYFSRPEGTPASSEDGCWTTASGPPTRSCASLLDKGGCRFCASLPDPGEDVYTRATFVPHQACYDETW